MTDEAVIWHDIECGAYAADLPLWEALAAAAAGPVLDVGAGTGRVTLHLAARGHDVTALDHDPALLEVLRARAAGAEVTPATVVADARELSLPRRDYALCIVPMQTIQLLGGPEGRAGLLGAAARHVRAGGRLAAALADELEPFDGDRGELPLPDVREHGARVYASQPMAVRRDAAGWTIERLRRIVSAAGERMAVRDTVRLDHLSAATLEREGAQSGWVPDERRRVSATPEHAASTVVILRRG